MLDGIKGAVKSWFDESGSDPISIAREMKDIGGAAFNTVSAGWYARNGYPGIAMALSGGLPAWSGEPVSVDSSMALSAVWACNRIISESVGFLPCNMMRKRGDKKEAATDHPMCSALENAPNAEQTTQNFTEMLTSHTVMSGNAYAQIIRRSGTGTAVELYALEPQNVRPDREKAGKKRLIYEVKEDGNSNKVYPVDRDKPQGLLHIRGLGWDGIRGYSVVGMARQSFGTAIAQERNVARFYANGGRVPYVLEWGERFKTDADFDKFRASWEKTYSEPHKAPILENGLKYTQIGLSAADAQLLESRQFTIPEICRWFLVSPHLVGDLSRATFSNIESLADQFVRFTLMTWLTRWEQELWRCVLTPDEKGQGYYFRHDLRALLRSDFQSRMQGYATMLQNGIKSINEVRADEDWNPVDGGDDRHIQLNMQTLPGGIPTASQAAALVKVGSSKQ